MTWDAISRNLEITRLSVPPGPGAAELTIAESGTGHDITEQNRHGDGGDTSGLME